MTTDIHQNSITDEIKATCIIAMPLAAALIAEIAMIITDHAIVGRMGSTELGAVGIAGNYMMEILIVGTAIMSIVGVFVAQAYGAKKFDDIGHHVRQGLWVAIALSIPGTIATWYGASLLAHTGQDPAILPFADDYLQAVSACFLPSMLFVSLRAFTSALSRTTAVMVITVGAVGINALLSYSLVFGKFGAPAMGVTGAGLATSIICWLMFFVMAIYVYKTPGIRRYRVFSNLFVFDIHECMRIIKLGMPVGAIALVEGGMFFVMIILVGTFGAQSLAANQAVINMTSMAFVVTLSIGEAASIRVAYGIGEGSMANARRAGLVAFGLGAVFAVLAGIVFIFFGRPLIAIFLNLDDPRNAGAIALALNLFVIAAMFQLTDGVQAIATRALRGMKDTIAPMWIATLGYWGFGIGSGYVLAFPMGYGEEGLWLGVAVGLSVTGAALAWRFVKLSTGDVSRYQ